MADNLPVPSPRGRPSAFNQERAERLINAVRAGNYYATAAAYAGISYSTLRRWILKSEDADAPPEYIAFREALEKARADAEVAALAKIQKASNEGAWQAAAWYLERSHPDRWGKREQNRLEITGEGGGPVRVVGGFEMDVSGMSALAQRLAARQAEHEAEIVDAEVIDDYASELEEGGSDIISDSEIAEAVEAWEGDNDA